MYPRVAARQPQESVENLYPLWSPAYQKQFRSEFMSFLVQCIGRSLDTLLCLGLCVLSLILTFSCWSSMPRRRPVCCVPSKSSIFHGLVRFATNLTGSVESFWFSVSSAVCIVAFAVLSVTIVVAVIFC